MSRVFKFRAWDGIIKRWLNATEVTIECVNGDVVRTYFPEGNKQLNPPNTELSQSTGLHDKNGKEIYEGDIIQVEYSDEGAPDIYTGDVCFEDGGWQMNVIATQKHPSHTSPFSEQAKPEIIGNIYENPELLKS